MHSCLSWRRSWSCTVSSARAAAAATTQTRTVLGAAAKHAMCLRFGLASHRISRKGKETQEKEDIILGSHEIGEGYILRLGKTTRNSNDNGGYVQQHRFFYGRTSSLQEIGRRVITGVVSIVSRRA